MRLELGVARGDFSIEIPGRRRQTRCTGSIRYAIAYAKLQSHRDRTTWVHGLLTDSVSHCSDALSVTCVAVDGWAKPQKLRTVLALVEHVSMRRFTVDRLCTSARCAMETSEIFGISDQGSQLKTSTSREAESRLEWRLASASRDGSGHAGRCMTCPPVTVGSYKPVEWRGPRHVTNAEKTTVRVRNRFDKGSSTGHRHESTGCCLRPAPAPFGRLE